MSRLGAILAIALMPWTSNALDLQGSFSGPVEVSNGVIRFYVTFVNMGEGEYDGEVSVKPFLLPSQDHPQARIFQKAVVLPTQNLEVSLGRFDRFTTIYQASLPKVEKNSYLLGGLVNSTARVSENTNNNQTNRLISVGEIEHNVPGAEIQRFDLYSDIPYIEPRRGGAYHRWRLFKRGNGNTSGLRTIFLIADLKKQRLYHSNYEKSVGWVNMGQDFDENGDLIPYDVYSQAPSFEHVPAGEYYFLTLINNRDTVTEGDHSNNLDMHRFKVSHAQPVETQEIWENVELGAQTEIVRDINLTSNYQENTEWEIDSNRLPPWLVVTPNKGVLGTNSSQMMVTVRLNPAELLEGVHEYDIPVKVAQHDEVNTIPVRLFVQGKSKPVARADESIVFRTTTPFVPGAKAFSVRNEGNADLHWRVAFANHWILFPGSEKKGVIPPGESASVQIIADPHALGAGTHAGRITIETNDGSKELSQIQMNVTLVSSAPNQPESQD